MITCNLCGGLGNQLFQIFTTISYAIKYNIPFVFLYSEISPSITHRITYWNTFLKSLKAYTRINIPINKINIYEKPCIYTDLEIPKLNNTIVCINGYFQSYKYFENYENIILKLIMFEEVKKGLIEHLQITDTFFNNSASIHFRLGDFKNLQAHPIVAYKYEYYEKSILFLQENNTINKIYFFCENEDINYVLIQINKLKLKFPDITFIRAFHELPDWQQLILMSCCNHNIIGNSTFSWWGAYFNTNPGRVVCYPYIWHGPNIPDNDLCPPSWTKITW
jgi:hypothetical protein